MITNKMFIAGIATAVFLTSCSPKSKEEVPMTSVSKPDSTGMQTAAADKSPKDNAIPTGDNSETSLDWNGTYEAVVPCADCPGIKTSLTLNTDKTFNITEEYIDRKSKNQDKGSFEWDTTGSVITLKGKSANYKYKVGENKLIQLDMDGKEIGGPNKDLYVFKKK